MACDLYPGVLQWDETFLLASPTVLIQAWAQWVARGSCRWPETSVSEL